MAEKKGKFLFVLKYLLLVFVIFIGINIRLDDQVVWQKRQNLYFLEGNPLFTSYDAFLYARYAKDYLSGSYHSGKTDPFRFVPDNFLEGNNTYPTPIPQISFLSAKGSSLLNISLEDWSFYAIPIMACLFSIPLFIFLERLGFSSSAFLGSFAGVLCFIYVIRTSICRLDTDALNLFYPFSISLFLLLYFKIKKPFNFISLAIAAVLGNLFFHWYGHASDFMFVYLLCFSFIIFLEDGFRFSKKSVLIIFLFILSQIWFIWQAPFTIYHSMKSYLFMEPTKNIFAAFPNVLQSISEAQKAPSWQKISLFVCPPYPLFLLGLIGFISFLLFEKRFSVLLIPPFLVGLLVFKSGNRFGMFLAPYIGIGIGFWIHLLINKGFKIFKKDGYFLKEILVLFFSVCIGIVIWYNSKNSRNYVASPKIPSPIAKNLKLLRIKTPKEAWIWTWWDYGYAINYLGRRAVFIDGGTQTTPKTYYVALSFATASSQEAYNIISFITNEGLKGIQERLEKGYNPKRLTDLIKKGAFHNKPSHPVYWLFTGDLPSKFAWIGYFGSWNFNTQKGKYGVMITMQNCKQKGPDIYCSNGQIDLKRGQIKLKNKIFKLKELIIRTAKDIKKQAYHPQGLILESVPSHYGRLLFVVDHDTFESNFNKMFILRIFDKRYFNLIFDDFPYAVLYQVRQ